MLNLKQGILKQHNLSQPTIVEQKFSTSNLKEYYRNEDTPKTESSPDNIPISVNLSKQPISLAQEQIRSTKLEQNDFFEVMDIVDQYDKKIRDINELYSQGMLKLAQVKFLNPYTSLSAKGYKPTPALVKIILDQDQKVKQSCQYQQKLKLIQEKDYPKFTYSMKKEQDKNENEQDLKDQQAIIQNQCRKFDLYSLEQLIAQQEQVEKQCHQQYQKAHHNSNQFILERFNIESQRNMILEAQSNFQKLLQKLLELNQFKSQKINKVFEKMQKQKEYMRVKENQQTKTQ